MFEYKFVKLQMDRGLTTSRPIDDYHEIIRDHASKGWRLIQIFAPPTTQIQLRAGYASFFELIFEREVDK